MARDINKFDKAIKTDRAMRQLRNEESQKGNMTVCDAISDYLASATTESKALLFDIVRAA